MSRRAAPEQVPSAAPAAPAKRVPPAAPAPDDLLAFHLSLVWIVLTLYGSLYPFSGWRESPVWPFGWLNLAWPYYWTSFDLTLNVCVYLPLGLFVTLALGRVWRIGRAALASVLLGAVLSGGVETLQCWLPSRVPSNLDFACNILGTLLGAFAALWGRASFRPLWRFWRLRLLQPLPHVDLGLTLLGLWLLIQLSPEIMLFGVGDLRESFPFLTLQYGPRRYRVSETAVIFYNLIALGLFVSVFVRARWMAFMVVPLFFLLAGAVRTLGAALLLGPDKGLVWLTLGAQNGLLMGAPMLLALLLLPLRWRLGLAAAALLAGTLLVNLTPLNPYSATAFEVWRRGHFLNFSGLTRWMAIIWPFLALPYLAWCWGGSGMTNRGGR